MHGQEIGCCRDLAVLDGNAGVLVRVLSALGRENVLLVRVGLAGVEVAVLEDYSGVTEDEVDGAVDVTLAVELAHGVCVDGVLVAHEAASVECGEVGVATEGDSLVLARPGIVLDRQVAGDESSANDSCNV